MMEDDDMAYFSHKKSFGPVHVEVERVSPIAPSRNSEVSVSLGEAIGASAWVGGTAVTVSDYEQIGGFRGATCQARDALVLRFPLSSIGVHRSSDDVGSELGCDLGSDQVIMLDLGTNPRLWRTGSSRWLHIGFDRSFLEGVADRAGGHHCGVMDLLRTACGRAISDPVIRELCASLASFAGHAVSRPTFTRDQILVALASHLVFEYGRLESITVTARGGLAPWQVRRSQEKMRARLYEPLNLEEVANDCGLSLSHFSRAFRCSVGMPPHAWRVRERVNHAKGLMKDPRKTLAEIAIECGFADQSHFTRVFSRETGASPGHWRRSTCDKPAQLVRVVNKEPSQEPSKDRVFDCHI
ncbi:AraC family transcriptional regulator [Sphingomonas sp. RB3P16]|uniref:helix-turn-helix domain-containing protein n=1 Tax=Parasphingomonas frigoris TaxID=3096163 RepID=UPI002FCBFD6B